MWRLSVTGIVVAIALGASAGAQSPPLSIDALLALSADYIARYERDVTAVVAQEDYQQRILVEAKIRQLRADLIMIADAANGWVEYRDVFEVDGKPVRDHDDRVMRLFTKPNPNARAQTERIVEESARFNLNSSRVAFKRTLNIPMTALRYLRAQNQRRSQFQIERLERTPAGPVAVIHFKEQMKPRLIGSREDAPASGSFWIDPQSGAVERSELRISSRLVIATMKVGYAKQLDAGIWLPASMDELYRLPSSDVAIDGRATYSNFRQFRVDVSTEVK